MERIHVYTCAGPDQLDRVLVLAESLREHLPEATIHCTIADRSSDAVRSGLAVETIDEVCFLDDYGDLGDPAWLFQHNVLELATAIKPRVARSLLARPECDLLLYFDSDMVVFSALDDLVAQMRTASVGVAPHLLVPETEPSAVFAREVSALRYGVFNLGFFAIRDHEEGWRFLDWWWQRCRSFCSADWQSGVFLDQRWIDFAPVFFPGTLVLRDPRFNVTQWNVGRRRLEGTVEDRLLIDGVPLGFCQIGPAEGDSPLELADAWAEGGPAAVALGAWVHERRRALTPSIDRRWSLGFYENGEAIPDLHRQLYRRRHDLQTSFPEPFRVSPDEPSLLSWIRQTAPGEHPDLFPPAPRTDAG